MAKDDKKPDCGHPEGDTAVLGPDLGNGIRPCFRHTPDHQKQIGFVQPLKDGEPIGENALSFHPVPGKNYCRVEPVLGATKPSMVNSQKYKDGWDGIFGKKQPRGQA